MQENSRFFVITGGPGSGKSTLIDALSKHGLRYMPEAGRAIIQDQVAIAGPALPWADRLLFAEMMLGWELRSYREAQGHGGTVFFDRGLPDVIGYLALCGFRSRNTCCGPPRNSGPTGRFSLRRPGPKSSAGTPSGNSPSPKRRRPRRRWSPSIRNRAMS